MLSRSTGWLWAMCLALALISPDRAWSAQPPGGERCKALATANFATEEEAAAQITSATLVQAQDREPASCEVQGYISPNIGFGLRLPLEHWNGKIVMLGCGGWCGEYSHALSRCSERFLQRGYACLAGDMGHSGKPPDALWGLNNLQAKVDFAFRATHLTVVSGKAVASRFYQSAPRHSYYMGCSQGGRQGLMSAQNFADDFDGIVVGAPGGVSGSDTGPLHLLWSMLAARDASGAPIFSPRDLELLNRAAIERCDADDGVRDGLIGNPARCAFRPQELLCRGGKTANCLTAQQVAAAQKIYDGPHTSSGKALATGGSAPGSEHNWNLQFGNPTPEYQQMIFDPYRYLFFTTDPGAKWQPQDFDFDRDPQRLRVYRAMYATTNPDLREYAARGGKLIYYHGWDDVGLPPSSAIDYYETVTRTMGGRDKTDPFFRLFLVPGMNHCSAGRGAYAIDYLSALERWVEDNHAPELLLGVHPKGVGDGTLMFKQLQLPLDPRDVEFSRPIYPYPTEARYSGHGDPNSADSFVPVPPPSATAAH